MRRWRLNSGYNGTTDQRRTKAGTIPLFKHHIERNLGFFDNDLGIIKTNLLLRLDAGNPASYPGTGTVWTDLSGNGNTGTLTNGPTYNSQKGGYISFDGVNDQIVLPSITPTSAVTFQAWIYMERFPTYSGAIFNNWGAGGNAYSIYRNTGSSIYVYFNAGLSFTFNVGIYLEKWIMITVTHDGSSIYGYINNYLSTFGTPRSLTSASNNTIIGGGYVGASPFPFFGNISQALIYNKALSLAEVIQNYNANKDRYGL